MNEVDRYVQSVIKQPSPESARAALERVPAHLRERVRMEARAKWKRKK